MDLPRLANWVLRLLVQRGVADDVIGDLREEYASFKLGELGRVRAGLWYWNQVFWVALRCGRVRWPERRQATGLAEGPVGGGSYRRMGLGADLRSSLRRITARPGTSLTVILTLGLGIGVTSAVFSAVNGVLLESLPYRQPQELVVVGGIVPGVGSGVPEASPPEYQEFLRGATTLTDLAAVWPLDANLTGEGAPVRVSAAAVTPNFFSLLGVEPLLGRDFREKDTQGNIGYAGILTHQAWVRFFGQDSAILGRRIQVEGDPITIVGVLPKEYSHPNVSGAPAVDIYAPIDLSEGTAFYFRVPREFTLIGRLAGGASLKDTRVEFEALSEAQERAYPDDYPPDGSWTVTVQPLLEQMVGDARTTLLLLFGSVGLVFLVVCTNVANLQLSQGSARAEELAVRASIGGSRWRIARQLFLESLTLASLGSAAGVGVALLGVHLLRDLLSPTFPRLGNVEMNLSVLLFATFASLLSVLVFGLLPAVRLSKVRPGQVTDSSLGRPQSSRSPLRDSFAGVQTALSLVLLIAAGLLFKSFEATGQVDLGFDPHGVLTMGTWLPQPNDRNEGDYISFEQRSAFFDRALREMESIPGVSAAAVTSLLPLRGLASVPLYLEARGKRTEPPPIFGEVRVVSDSYFEAMGIPVVAGRTFNPGDRAGTPHVVMISRTFADRHFLGKEPLGERVFFNRDPEAGFEIVGIVGDVFHGLGNPRSTEAVYRTFRQGALNEMTFVLRTSDRPEALSDPAEWALHRADPGLPGFDVAPMAEVVSESRRQHRVLVVLFGIFGVLTLTLSALGIYGVVSFAVSRRGREIGIRLALGGSKARVIRVLLGEGLRLGVLGSVLGTLVAMGFSRFLSGVLFEVRPVDPWVFSGSILFTLSMVAIASLIPALDAVNVGPTNALRAD